MGDAGIPGPGGSAAQSRMGGAHAPAPAPETTPHGQDGHRPSTTPPSGSPGSRQPNSPPGRPPSAPGRGSRGLSSPSSSEGRSPLRGPGAEVEPPKGRPPGPSLGVRTGGGVHRPTPLYLDPRLRPSRTQRRPHIFPRKRPGPPASPRAPDRPRHQPRGPSLPGGRGRPEGLRQNGRCHAPGAGRPGSDVAGIYGVFGHAGQLRPSGPADYVPPLGQATARHPTPRSFPQCGRAETAGDLPPRRRGRPPQGTRQRHHQGGRRASGSPEARAPLGSSVPDRDTPNGRL
jgi:hypothetical protein